MYNIYKDFLYKFTEDINDLNNLLNFKYKNDVLYTEEWVKLYYEELEKVNVEKEKYNHQRLKIITKRMEEEIYQLYNKAKKFSCIEENKILTYYLLLKERIIKLQLCDNLLEVRKEMLSMVFELFYFIEIIRRIWRSEINIDREIIDVLYKHNEKK